MADDKKIVVKKVATKTTTPKKTAPKKASTKKVITTKSTAKPDAQKAVVKKKSTKAVVKKTAPKGSSENNMEGNIKDLKSQASDSMRDTANKGKAKASEAMSGISGKIRETAETIDESLGEKYGGYARTTADTIDEFADTINKKNVDDIVEDTKNFVRKSPALAIGTAAAIGFLLTRLIRAGRD